MRNPQYRAAILVLLTLIMPLCLSADEGMWPLYDLGKLPVDKMHDMGLIMSLDNIYNNQGTGIASAVVEIGGGTGSFVSERGLIITNHHVAVDAAQKQSTVDDNYLMDGFYAGSLEKEIPAIGYNAYVTLSTEDVTERVLAEVNDKMTDYERFQALETAKKKIVHEAEEGRDVYCEVSSMFGGMQYVLYTYFKIRDIRIVYIPPYYIGNYGGDIDNWMWPRHVGDFSFLRAYTAPNGSSAEYAPENVPYHSKIYLPISSAGVKEGDFAMIMGFPGGTSRYAPSYEIEHLEKYYYPNAIKSMKDRIAILEEASAADSSAAIRLASSMQGINNYLKNSIGMAEGFQKGGLLEIKRANEKALTEFLQSDKELFEKYGHILPEYDSLYQQLNNKELRESLLRGLSYNCELYDVATTLHKWALEREKADVDRERGYQDRDSIKTREWLEDMQINFVESVDRITFKYYLRRLVNLPPDLKIDAIEKIFEGKKGPDREKYVDEYADRLYDGTILGNKEQRLKLFGMSKDKLEKLDDPFIKLAVALRPELDRFKDENKKIRGAEQRLLPGLIAAYAAWKSGLMYPDANSTMRFNYGSVRGYSPADAISYDYLTSLTGIMEKETDVDPFIVPSDLKKAFGAHDTSGYTDSHIKDVPVDFLTTNDGTGGNSGSPVLNGRGEITGLVFDGNYESISLDYLFNEKLVRSINVDIRFVLYLIDRVYNLDALMNELTVH
ncbi:MAG: S46 family peptidase [Candidatus Zixiibacteriota bacterium]